MPNFNKAIDLLSPVYHIFFYIVICILILYLLILRYVLIFIIGSVDMQM